MTDKVISLRDRKPLAQVQAEEAAVEEAKTKRVAEHKQMFLDAQLKLLDQVREQVAAGNLENLIIVSRNPHSGLFMQDMIFEPNFHINGLAFAFSGLLEALKTEVVDISQLTPTLNASGEKLDPHFEEGDELDGEEHW